MKEFRIEPCISRSVLSVQSVKQNTYHLFHKNYYLIIIENMATKLYRNCYSLRVHRYIGILVELTRIEGTRHGELIAGQMLDVAVRVEAVRSEACRQMAHLLANTPLLIGQKDSITQVLMAAAYICGEFSQ